MTHSSYRRLVLSILVILSLGIMGTRAAADSEEIYISDFSVENPAIGYHSVSCSAGAYSRDVDDLITLIVEMEVDGEPIGMTYSSGYYPSVTLTRQVPWAPEERSVVCVVYGGRGGSNSASAMLPAME